MHSLLVYLQKKWFNLTWKGCINSSPKCWVNKFQVFSKHFVQILNLCWHLWGLLDSESWKVPQKTASMSIFNIIMNSFSFHSLSFQAFFGCKYLAVSKMKTTPPPKQSRLFRNDAYFLQHVWKSHSEVVTGFDTPIVMKPAQLIKGRGNFQFSHEKHPKLERSGFLQPASSYALLRLQQVHVWEGGSRWWDCVFQSATLKTCVLLPNTRMFLSKCKFAYLRIEDVKVKTKAFTSFLNFMQNSQRWQWLTAVAPPSLLRKM